MNPNVELKQRNQSEHDRKQTEIIEQQFSDVDAEGITMNPAKTNLNIKTYKSLPKILARVLNLCFSCFYFGYTLAYLGSYDFSSMVTLYKIDENVQLFQGLLQSIISIGAGIGALSAGIIIRTFSRRNSILFINCAAFIFGTMVLFPNLVLFFVARFFQGMCVGLYSAIIPILIKQFTPTQTSGTFGALNQAFIAFGVFFAFALQLILLQINEELSHWRIQHGFTLVTIAIQTVLLLLVYRQETPKYLLLNGRQQQCIKFLQEIYKPQFVKLVLNEKKTDLNSIIKSKQSSEKSQSVGEILIQNNYRRGRIIRIFTAVDLAVLQQMVGINAVVAYGVNIVTKILPNLSKVIPVILNFQVMVFGLVSSIILGRVGRVVILQAGTMVSFISLVFVAVGFLIETSNSQTGNVFIMVGLFIFMGNFGVSLGPVVWLYIAQIVQPEIIPYTTLANWATATIVIMLFPVLSTAFGTPVPLFFFFAAWSFAFFFVNRKLLIETKGKNQKQIINLYSRK